MFEMQQAISVQTELTIKGLNTNCYLIKSACFDSSVESEYQARSLG